MVSQEGFSSWFSLFYFTSLLFLQFTSTQNQETQEEIKEAERGHEGMSVSAFLIMTNEIMKQEQKHTLNHHHFKNGLSYMFLFFLFLSLHTAAAQNNTQWQYDDGSYDSSNEMFSPTMGIALVVIVIALFIFGFCSIFFRNCNGESSISIHGGSINFRGGGGMSRRGLDPASIENLPTFTYSYVKDHHLGKGALECAVCLTEFEDQDTLRLLPKCDHVFHPECIDAWLSNRTTCPVCRANVASSTGFLVHDMEDDSDEEIATSEPGDVENQQVTSEAQQAAEAAEAKTKPARSKFVARFPRSNSTGHSLVQPGEDIERFTLRLPDDVRKQVMNMRQLNRTRSMASLDSLPMVLSSIKGYRMTGEGSSRGGRLMWEKPENWVLSMTPSFLMRPSKMTAEGRAPATPPRLKPFRSPLRAVTKANGTESSSTRPPV